MKKIIKLTESDLHNIIKETINTILQEDGEIGGGGATNCVGINVGGAAGQAKNHIDAAPFSNKPLKQKHNLGNPTTKKANMVDISPALDRTPGFSMGERVGGKKKVNEAENMNSKSKLKQVIEETIIQTLKENNEYSNNKKEQLIISQLTKTFGNIQKYINYCHSMANKDLTNKDIWHKKIFEWSEALEVMKQTIRRLRLFNLD